MIPSNGYMKRGGGKKRCHQIMYTNWLFGKKRVTRKVVLDFSIIYEWVWFSFRGNVYMNGIVFKL
jgi:hypothetical protein